MKRIMCVLLAMVFIFSLMFVGCGSQQAEKNTAKVDSTVKAEDTAKAAEPTKATDDKAAFDPAKFPVAVCMDNKNHPVHRIVQLGFLESAKKLGYKAEVVGVEGGDAPAYFAAVEAAAAKGVKGMLMWRDASATAFMKKLSDSGVKVVVPHFRFPDNTPGVDANLCADAADYGKAVADLFADKLKGKKGSVAVTQNTFNTTENAAAKGFTDEMKAKAPDIKVLAPVLEGADLTEAINKVAAVIQKNSDLIGGFGTTGGSPASWSGALDKTGKKDIMVIGMDYTEQNIDLVKQGKIFGIVAQPLYDEARMSMELLDKLFKGEKVQWFTPLQAPIAYVGGTDTADINYYSDIVKRVKEWFK